LHRLLLSPTDRRDGRSASVVSISVINYIVNYLREVMDYDDRYPLPVTSEIIDVIGGTPSRI
jgi:hypothetical protein